MISKSLETELSWLGIWSVGERKDKEIDNISEEEVLKNLKKMKGRNYVVGEILKISPCMVA